MTGRFFALPRTRIRQFFKHLKKALWQSLAHDAINTAKASAYSGMLMFFPIMLVLTTILAQLPAGNSLVGEVRLGFEQLLPADTLSMLQSYILSRRLHSFQVIFSAAALSLFAGLGLMLSLMEGFRRAYSLRGDEWGFWSRRVRAMLLVPIVLFPLALSTVLLVFGRQIEYWMINNAGHELRGAVLFFWRMVRWIISFATSVAVLGALYHFGTRRKEHWAWVIPGAIAATLLWFPVTLAFGWYVTRIADYSMFYGSFGAAIATLVWLYLTSFSALFGAEINGVLFGERKEKDAAAAR
jgi:membrane protein